jgi:hypothetical protein
VGTPGRRLLTWADAARDDATTEAAGTAHLAYLAATLNVPIPQAGLTRVPPPTLHSRKS